ncbi:MAG: sulfite reductase [Chlamydiota bacterium]|nr:sulfite reductase [Chlamydiota bacterium]
MKDSTPKYSRLSPFIATIKHREDLCRTCPEKNTHHIIIDLKNSGLTYEVGDCLGVYPVNDPILLDRTLVAMKVSGDETVEDKKTGEAYPLREYLRIKGNITDISRKLFKEIVARQSNAEKKEKLEFLLAKENGTALKEYLYGKHLWDVLSYHHEVEFTPQEICDMLMPLLPRFYSIASSQGVVNDEVHLTVKLLSYEAHGHPRQGVCTHYLCNLAPEEEPIVPIFVQPHKGFTVPEASHVPIIMVGPGTGVAPFRAFMQERIATGAVGKNWLFFGEWRREHNFLYQDFWLDLENQGKLRLDVAFSRDQDEKIYVQHLLADRGKDVFQWINEGAHFYVCGDAKYMAKDVDTALHDIVRIHGGFSEEEAKAYIKQMRKDKRYLRDVY